MSSAVATNGKSAKSASTLVGREEAAADDITSSDTARPNLPAAPVGKKSGKKAALIGILALMVVGAAAGGTLYWLHARQYESTDDATVEGRVVPISPQIAARVNEVLVADNAVVHKGDKLVLLDPTNFQVVLDQTRASLASARGKLAQSQAQVQSAVASRDQCKAEVAVNEANAQMASDDHDRYVDASRHNSGAVSKQQMDSATAVWRSTQAQVAQARAKLAATEAQIVTAQAGVQTAQADLDKAAADVHQAEVNLSYCTLTAPEDGRVTKKSVEPGSYVQVGQNLLAIVPSDLWIVADFKETQLDHLRKGQPVSITIDAYPDKEFTGKVESIQSGTGSRFSLMPPENATGNYVKVVQRVPVKIAFDPGQLDDNHPLGPGMSAVPEVKVR